MWGFELDGCLEYFYVLLVDIVFGGINIDLGRLEEISIEIVPFEIDGELAQVHVEMGVLSQL